MSEIRLYWYWTTNTQKVRFALEKLSLSYECITINLGIGELKQPDFLGTNPRGKVPALELNGTIICEFNAIVMSLVRYTKRLCPKKLSESRSSYILKKILHHGVVYQCSSSCMFKANHKKY